jgi:hypothetical protein
MVRIAGRDLAFPVGHPDGDEKKTTCTNCTNKTNNSKTRYAGDGDLAELHRQLGSADR